MNTQKRSGKTVDESTKLPVYKQAVKDAAEKGTSIPEEMILTPPLSLHDELPLIFEDAPALQRAVLDEILDRGLGSVWARSHNILEADAGNWLANAPITQYEDYRPFIDAELNGDERRLFNAPIDTFLATTGSTGEPKYFLESRAGTMAKMLIMRSRGIYMRTHMPVTGDIEAKNLTISNYAPVGKTPTGREIVRASGQTARGLRVKTGTMNILPEDFWLTSDLTPEMRDYMMGAYALGEVRFSKVFANNLVHFGRILDCINENAPRMIKDVARGEFDLPISEDTRALIADSFPARPERAAELEEILSRRGSLAGSPEAIGETWPNLRLASGWLCASVGRDAREVLRRLPKRVRCFEMGYGSSEAKLAIPLVPATSSGVCAPFALYYEFLPLDANQDARPLPMWEVEVGKYYELVITTYSGLYRYNTKDIVSVDGFVGKTPLIAFNGKSSEYLEFAVPASLDASKIRNHSDNSRNFKIYGFQFSEVVLEVERALGIEFDLFQILPADGSWYWMLETKSDTNWSDILAALDKKCLEKWGLRSSGVLVMKHDYKNLLFTALTRPTRGACGIKLPVIVQDSPDQQDVARLVN